jgi:hypothetical protein
VAPEFEAFVRDRQIQRDGRAGEHEPGLGGCDRPEGADRNAHEQE